MREIKFRALEKHTDEWQFGYYLADKYDSYISDFEGVESIVIPETVGQFTGLKDKNGIEIYEGDIITFQRFSNYGMDGFKMHFATVIFKEGCFMWDIFKEGTNGSYNHSDKNEPLRRTCAIWGLEVIGNVHQTPELL